MALCRSCGAEIAWVKTEKGKSMPVDIDSWDGNRIFTPGKHISHFASCPNAAKHRKPRDAN